MEFNESRNIFLQIADWINDQILMRRFNPGDRLPSVRELAGEMEVNRNTVMRTYSNMNEQGILENKRGIGFFVADKAPELILARQKEIFFEEELPKILHRIEVLKLTSSDLEILIQQLKNNDHENK